MSKDNADDSDINKKGEGEEAIITNDEDENENENENENEEDESEEEDSEEEDEVEEEDEEEGEESEDDDEEDDDEEVIITKKKLKALQKKAAENSAKDRINKRKEKEPSKKKEESSSEILIARLEARQVFHQEDQKLVINVMKKSGMTLQETMKDPFVKSTLEANKTRRKVSKATPSGNKKGGTIVKGAKYYIDRGLVPDRNKNPKLFAEYQEKLAEHSARNS